MEVSRKPKVMDMFALGIMPNIELHGVVKLVRLWESVCICSIMARFTQIEVCTLFTTPPLIFNSHETPIAWVCVWFPHWVVLVGAILLHKHFLLNLMVVRIDIVMATCKYRSLMSTCKCHSCVIVSYLHQNNLDNRFSRRQQNEGFFMINFITILITLMIMMKIILLLILLISLIHSSHP